MTGIFNRGYKTVKSTCLEEKVSSDNFKNLKSNIHGGGFSIKLKALTLIALKVH